MVIAPRMPLQPGAMNIPKSGVNISRSWSGVSFCPSPCANPRAICDDTCCSGRSMCSVKKLGTGFTNHVSATGNNAARNNRTPPNSSTAPAA